MLSPEETTRVDVAYQGNIMLHLEVEVPQGEQSQAPTATVSETYGSFECEIVGIDKVRTRDDVETYSIEVDWFPGSDMSGCFVDVEDPFSGEISAAELYMVY